MVPRPPLPKDLRIEWHTGIDLNPINVTDVDAMRWLRALIVPAHLDRQGTIEAAARVAREHPHDESGLLEEHA